MQQFKDDFILFVEAGFIAVGQSDEDAASKLFKVSELLKPEDSLPKVGLGFMHLCKLELKQACTMFEEVLKKEPNNEMAKTFLGISLSLSPTEAAKGEKILADSVKGAHNPDVKQLAGTALDFVDKFVKKAPSPAQVQKPKGK